jgi:hypothetical protein
LSNLDLTSTNQQQDAWKSIGLRTNFYLQYQAKNDLELQKKYGELVYKIASVNFPNWVKNLTIPTGKIRLGYISAHLRHHTVAKLFQGWLQWRNREQFEIYCGLAIVVIAIPLLKSLIKSLPSHPFVPHSTETRYKCFLVILPSFESDGITAIAYLHSNRIDQISSSESPAYFKKCVNVMATLNSQ